MASEAKIKLVLKGDDQTGAAFQSASKGAAGFGSSIKALLPVLGVAGLAGAIGSILQNTAQFEQRLSDVSTLISGDSTEAVNELRDGIQNLMKTTPKSADELGAAAYQLVSAGISDTTDVIKGLNAASKLSVAGLGAQEDATTLLATALNAFGKSADEADQVADVLFKTVKFGQTNVQQLSQAFGKMAGNAAAANISLEDVQAATAAITTVTGKTSEAQNALAQVFLELTVSGGKLDKSLQEQGGSLSELNRMISERGGVVEGFEAMRDRLGLTDTQFKNLFSSAEGGTAVFQLLTSANEAYNNTLDEMLTGSVAIDEAYKKQNEQFAQQYQILKNNLNVEFQKLAVQVLPVLIEGMKFLTEVYLPQLKEWWDSLIDSLGNFIFKIQQAIDKIKELARAIKENVSGAFNKVTDFLGTGIYNASNALGLNAFADGGVVPGHPGQPQLAMVHGGETIIPYGKESKGSGVTVNINGGMYLNEQSATMIGNMLVDRLQTEFRF